MNAEFRAKDLPQTPDIRAGRGRSHKLHSHGKPRAADCSGRLAGRAGGGGRRRAGGRGVAGRAGRAVRPAAEFRPRPAPSPSPPRSAGGTRSPTRSGRCCGWRVLPAPVRGWLRLAGPYGRAAVLWSAGERDAALASLAGSPRRLAAFALAADQPAAAAAAVDRLARDDRALPVLAARLAWRKGRLTGALRALDGAPGRQARRLRATLTAEQFPPPGSESMIAGSSGQIDPKTARDHETATQPVAWCLPHLTLRPCNPPCGWWCARSFIIPPTRGSTTGRSAPCSTPGTRSGTSLR